MNRLVFIALLLVLLLPLPAFAHPMHGPEKHIPTVQVLGDRIAVDYFIYAQTKHRSQVPDLEAKMSAYGSQIGAMQTVHVDGVQLPLDYVGYRITDTKTHFRYETAPGSVAAGEHTLNYQVFSRGLAREFEIKLQARHGGTLPHESAKVYNQINLRTQFSADGQAPPENEDPFETGTNIYQDLMVRFQETSGPGFWVGVLLISFVLGIFHTLAPGHGKNLAMAYLIDRKGRNIDAFLFATGLAISHTMLAFLIGVVGYVFGRDIDQSTFMPWIRLGAGVLMGGMGSYMLFVAITGKHFHLKFARAHDHRHEHEQGIPHQHPETRISKVRTVLLGALGGVAPCPEALALLLIALGANRIGAGAAMILAFATGMWLVMFVLGLAVVNAGTLLQRLLKRKNGKLTRWLSLISAGGITIVGIVFIYYAVINLL